MKSEFDHGSDNGSTDFIEALLSRHRATLAALERHYEDHLAATGMRSRPQLHHFLKLASEEVRDEARLLDRHLEGAGNAFPYRPPARMIYLALGEDAMLRERLMITLGLAYEKDQSRRLPGSCMRAQAAGKDEAKRVLERLLRSSKRRARKLARFLHAPESKAAGRRKGVK